MSHQPARARLWFYAAVFVVAALVGVPIFVETGGQNPLRVTADMFELTPEEIAELNKQNTGQGTIDDKGNFTAATEAGSTSFQLEKPEGLPEMFADANEAIPRLWEIAIVVAAVAFLVLLLVGGVMYLSSAGSDDGTKKAKTLLVDAAIGLILVVVAWPVGKWVISQLGNPGGFFANPSGQATLESRQPTGGSSGGTGGTSTGTSGSTPSAKKVARPVQIKFTEDGEPAARKTARAVSKDGTTTVTGTTDLTGATTLDLPPNVYDFSIGDKPVGTRTIEEGSGTGAVTFDIPAVVTKRTAVISVIDNKTFTPVSDYSFLVWRRPLIDGPDELIESYTTGANGKAPAIDLIEGEILVATPINGNAELGSFIVPAQNGTAWTILIPASLR